jgi:hypothetical protein
MSADRVTSTTRDCVPTGWTEADDLFFTLVAEVLSTAFLWGAATLLASYDADPDDDPAAPVLPREIRPPAALPTQRSLAG